MASRAKTVICLLRNDLRLQDNEAFTWAQQNGDHVLPLYCFDPRHYQGTRQFGFPKTGPFRLKFLIECLQDLRNSLVKQDSNLVLRYGQPEVVVVDLIRQLGVHNIGGIVFQKEATSEESEVEDRIRDSAGTVPVTAVWGVTLYHREDLPFSTDETPDVFTKFRKQIEQARIKVRKLAELPETLKPLPAGIDPGVLPKITDFGYPEPVADSRSAFPFAGGENSAQHRLHYYLWGSNRVASYKETRNGMIGTNFSTKFSPWLALGCISARQIFWEIKKYEKERTENQSTYWVIFELMWRDYFKFVALKYREKLFAKDGLLGKDIDWREDREMFDAWKDGRTGVPFVDANMREMAATGFMSNRGRQNVASFLNKDLKLDWRLGAEWFESFLVDHDLSSNYGNWLYSAGLGNDPRENRKFNMVKQGFEYDPDGDYIRQWVPELSGLKESEVHIPWTLGAQQLKDAGIELGVTYPRPIVVAPEWIWPPARGGWGRGRGRGRGRGFMSQTGMPRSIDHFFKSQGQNQGPSSQ